MKRQTPWGVYKLGSIKDCRPSPEAKREAWNRPSLRTPTGHQAHRHPDFGLPGSRTVRQNISVVLRHSVLVLCYNTPQERTQPPEPWSLVSRRSAPFRSWEVRSEEHGIMGGNGCTSGCRPAAPTKSSFLSSWNLYQHPSSNKAIKSELYKFETFLEEEFL